MECRLRNNQGLFVIFLIYFFAIGNWKSGTITGGTNTNKKKTENSKLKHASLNTLP